jgi:peptidoglycan/xylan/chitin deacetylase (PgdA/CDA1 family)
MKHSFAIQIVLPLALAWSLLSAAIQAAPALEPIPAKLVVLTFDDSVASHYSVVRPLLKKYGFGATFFITEGFSFRTNKQDYMTWEQIAELHRDGFEIGNHTRDHMGVNAGNLDKLAEQIEAINVRCEEHGIPRPISFGYPGNAIHPGALRILKQLGIRFARRGGAPEFPYEGGRGTAYEPSVDHPLLIPSAGDARPNWTLEDFKRAVRQARVGRIAVLQFHGVPDREHPWVHTPPELFEQYLAHLHRNGYRVLALRDLARFVDPNFEPVEPMAVIETRKASPSKSVLVRGEVFDAEANRPVACRLYLRDAQGRWHFPDSAVANGTALSYQKRNWINTNAVEMHTTLSADPFELELPPGRYTFTAERGKEFFPENGEFVVGAEPPRVECRLRRWIDMAELGWYSGDTHVHRSLEEVPNLMLAEDLNVAFPLSYWVTRGFTPPTAGDKNLAGDFAAVPVRVDATHVFYPRNTEYEIFTVNERSHTLGALFVLNHKSAFTLGAPPVRPIAEQARREGALLDLDKHNWPWSMALVPILPVDLFELANNHHWRTEYGITNWSVPAPGWMGIGSGTSSEREWTLYGFQNYYALLNCGFRLRPTAGTANGVHPVPLGFGRVYVHLPKGFSYEEWLRGLNAGRSFVTTGPMLLAELNGEDPGHTFRKRTRANTFKLTGRVVSEQPASRIEVIANGRVVQTLATENQRTRSGAYENRLRAPLEIAESSWIAVRCFEERADDRVRFAHTAPWHVEVTGHPLRPRREEVEFLVHRVREQIARSEGVLPQAALAEYRQALAIYESLRETAR